MEKAIARFILLVLVTVFAGCAAHTAAEKTALDRASNLDFTKPAVGISDPSVIVPHSNLTIVKVDGASEKHFWIPGKNIIFVPPGKHILSVQIDTGMVVGQRTGVSSGRVGFGTAFSSKVITPLVDIEYDFERGKHYSLNYKMGFRSTDFIFTEITDANTIAKIAEYTKEYNSYIEDLESYLSFYTQNQNLLEGKWETGKGKDELEFAGNKVKYVAEKVPLYSTRPSLEGTFLYDQDTLITIWDKYQTVLSTFTREESPANFPKAVWLYKLSEDTLEITSGGRTPLNINGVYKRVK